MRRLPTGDASPARVQPRDCKRTIRPAAAVVRADRGYASRQLTSTAARARGAGITGHQISDAVWSSREFIHYGPLGMMFVFHLASPELVWAQLAPRLLVDDLVAVGDAIVGGRAALGTMVDLRRIAEAYVGHRGAKKIAAAIGQVRVGSLSRPETAATPPRKSRIPGARSQPRGNGCKRTPDSDGRPLLAGVSGAGRIRRRRPQSCGASSAATSPAANGTRTAAGFSFARRPTTCSAIRTVRPAACAAPSGARMASARAPSPAMLRVHGDNTRTSAQLGEPEPKVGALREDRGDHRFAAGQAERLGEARRAPSCSARARAVCLRRRGTGHPAPRCR